MRAQTFAHIRANDVLGELSCQPPLTLRQVHGDAGECALCLVGTAAGPLAGDDLRLDLRVDDGATARLSATGAALAQGRGGAPSSLTMTASVGAGARLHADPGPLVVAEGSSVTVSVSLDLAADASLEWHELVVFGRTTDPAPGHATLRWDVVRAGRPVLRQAVDSTSVHPYRVMASGFVTDPDLDAETQVLSPTAVAQRIDPHTLLVTVLGHDAAAVRRDLAGLLAQVQASPVSGASSASTVPSIRP